MIYHITLPSEWDAAQLNGLLAPLSLATEGFIHCSDRRQLERSLNRFFAGRDRVLILEIDPDLLTGELRYEGADNDMFPHIHAPLNIDAVIRVIETTPDEDGNFSFV